MGGSSWRLSPQMSCMVQFLPLWSTAGFEAGEGGGKSHLSQQFCSLQSSSSSSSSALGRFGWHQPHFSAKRHFLCVIVKEMPFFKKTFA